MVAEIPQSSLAPDNCVYLARDLDQRFRDELYPFSLDDSKVVRSKTSKAEFPFEVEVPMCDGTLTNRKKCGKRLWSEQAWLPLDKGKDDAYCERCGKKHLEAIDGSPGRSVRRRDGTLFELDTTEISRMMLTCTDSAEVAAAASAESSTQTQFYEQIDHGAIAEVIGGDDGDGLLQPKPTSGHVRMLRSTMERLGDDLQSLRRRKSNGLMSGIIHFMFKNPTKTLRAHLANFVVSNDCDKHVYIINLQSREVVTDVRALKDADSYANDVFFLPSPERPQDLESVADAVANAEAVKAVKLEGGLGVKGASSSSNEGDMDEEPVFSSPPPPSSSFSL